MNSSTFTDNSAPSSGGGGIYNTNTLTVNSSTFTDNSAYSGIVSGGGIFNTGTLILSNSTFTGNSSGEGGGITNRYYGTMVLTNSTFTVNSGGAIANIEPASIGTSTVSNCTFTDNNSQTGCAGIENGATLMVANCTFTDNSATYDGGGIHNYYPNTLTVDDSVFTGNNSSGEGGGIENDGGTLTVNNSSFTGNSSVGGGGIYNCDLNSISDGTLTVTNSTFTSNSADAGGGISNDGTLTLNNTIVAGNTATIGGQAGPDIQGQVQPTSAYNLIGDGSGMTNQPSSSLIGTTTNPINPMLGPLQNNAGATETMALLPGSPAIDAGSNALAVDANGNPLTTDQRGAGFPRILGHSVDIGAYEFSPLSQTISFGPLANQTYGVVTLTATASSNLPVGYTVISGPATVSGDILTATGTGVVDVEADQAGNATYAAATPVDELFTVTPATLTITANPASEVYGGPMPKLSASYSGFVNGDTAANLTTQPTLTTVATTSSPVLSGGYNISVSGASDSNYTISYIDNTLTVTPAPLTITANDAVNLYGSALPTLTASYTGFVNSDTVASLTTQPTLTTVATTSSYVNADGYVITASGASDPNYTITYIAGTLTVTPAPLTVTATKESMTYGGTVPTLTYAYTGLVNGDTSATFTGSAATTATSSSNVGVYPITQGTLTATGNYTINTYDPSILTIAKADTIITVTPYSVSYDGNVHNATGTSNTGLVINSAHINAGTYTDSWTYIDPNGNSNSQTGIISDTIAKANASINVTPYSVTYDGTSHTATGVITGVNGVSLNGLVVNSTHTNAGTYSDTWTFTDTTGNYYNASGTITDSIAKATANITVVGYTTTYDGMPHEAAGAAIDVNNTVLAGLNLPAHTISGTYIDTWTFSNPNYNYASGTVIDTITKANANIAVVGYNTF